MRIVLDIRYRTRSGAASYIDNIVPGLVQAASRHEFILLKSRDQNTLEGLDCETVRVDQQSAWSQAIADQVVLPRLLQKLRADAYHPMKHLGTMYPPCPQVITAHSITLPFRGVFPTGTAEGVYWRLMGTRMFRRSAALIAVSEFVRDFLIERIGIDPGRIQVIHHGVDSRFRRLSPEAALSAGTSEDYILTVGNIFPVKNFIVAARVFAAIAGEWPGLRFKMAGSTAHPYSRQIRAELERAGLADRVDYLGFTSPDELVRLLNRALVLLMPSLTEGCPVTLLEAMACGTPTIGAGRGGIPEVGGDAIVIVDDPHDVPSWVRATRSLLQDSVHRQRLQEAALTRASDFTWTRAVRRTFAVYDSLPQPASVTLAGCA